MASLFTMAQRDAARRVNLYAWLLTHYPAEHRREGNELRATGINHHITIKRDANYYRDWATNEAGNPIDYLTRHLGYSVADATRARNPSLETIRPEGFKDWNDVLTAKK